MRYSCYVSRLHIKIFIYVNKIKTVEIDDIKAAKWGREKDDEGIFKDTEK